MNPIIDRVGSDAVPERPAMLWGAAAIADYLGLTEHTVRHLIDRGVVPAFKLAGRIVARPTTLDRWLEEQERAALDELADAG
jgi:excisionase family DNA binding protein